MEQQLKLLSKEAASDVDFVCCGAENYVKVAGSWNKWRPQNMIYSEPDDVWMLSLNLKPGRYQYKYIVDGEWIHDPTRPSSDDGKGNINNVIVVESKLDVVVRNWRMAKLQKTVRRLKKTHAEIKELKQKLGTCWYNEVEKHKLDPKAGV
eukprot:TRINITY_DN40755_c0_g1_i1.p1 TRINITY_DN40755_c0_g1~~TRINITY_DN40755_c0_g1_i1.p1  ORF type:complete len:150 (-),score=35.08 TRINITY_DN40755_c0_g1_i1:78-527(-)